MPTIVNNLEDLRRRFSGGNGERPSHNEVLKLCDEIEALRKANIELGHGQIMLLTENSELRKQLADSIKRDSAAQPASLPSGAPARRKGLAQARQLNE